MKKGQRCIFYEAKKVFFERKFDNSTIPFLPAPGTPKTAAEQY